MRYMILVLFYLLFTPSLVHADSITTFYLSGDYGTPPHVNVPSTGTVFGSMTVNTTTGEILSVNFDYSDSVFPESEWLVGYPTQFTSVLEIGEVFNIPGRREISVLDLLIPVGTLVDYAGGPICSIANPCSANSAVHTNSLDQGHPLLNGQLTTTPITPEPSSFLLLATGIAGVFGMSRRKIICTTNQ